MTGILVDVSGSMQESLTDDFKVNDQDKKRAHAVFDTIFKTIKEDNHDERKNNNTSKETFFALAFGFRDTRHPHCDLFGLFDNLLSSYVTKPHCKQILRQYGINNNQEQYIKTENKYNIERCAITGYEPLIAMARRNGAPYAGEYIEKHLNRQEAGDIFMQFYHHQHLIRVTVDELPDACKNYAAHRALQVVNNQEEQLGWGGAMLLNLVTAGGASMTQQYGRDEADRSAQKALEKARERILTPLYEIVREPRSRKTAKEIIDRLGDAYPLQSSDDTANVGVDEILDDIRSRIFGGTPMCQSLRYSQQIFELNSQNNKQKRLLIISDGMATDGDPLQYASALRNKDVIVACCFITKA
eukprot:458096_1